MPRVPLRVGLNLVFLQEQSGGAGRYARELIPSLLTVEPGIRLTAFMSTSAPPDLAEQDWASEVDFVTFPVPAAGSPVHWAAEFTALPAVARARRLDVVHGPANVVPPLAPGVATVVTLLDLIWIHYPDTMDRRSRLTMRAISPACARAADRVIAISSAARDDFVETLGLPRSKIDVTHLGVRMDGVAPGADEGAVRAELGIGDGPVVLCVAQKRVHKNLLGLVEALAKLRAPRPWLVIPGSPTDYEEQVRARAIELGVADRLVLPAWLPEDRLEALYGMASCFVLPSFQEGFGLPILEAMRRGVPVACSDMSSLPEVAGGAAELFDPRDPGSIAGAIEGIVREPAHAADLARRGTERARELTWERTAEATLEVYRRALRPGRRRVPRPGPRAAAGRPLAVGLVLTWLVEDSGGTGRYVRELIGELLALEPRTRIVAYVAAKSLPPDVRALPWADEVEWVEFPVTGVGPPWHFAYQFGAVPWNAARARLDVVHGPAYFVPPVAPRVATVATVLDLIWLHHPESVPPRARLIMPALAPLCARSADRVVTISQAARGEIAAEWSIPETQIDVTPLGVRERGGADPTAPEALRVALGLGDGPVVLCVAQKRVHKNLARLIEAFAQLDDARARLVLPGARTPYEDELRALARRLGAEERVVFPEWLTEADLEGLYRLATCFVLPSLEEGFGLPVLEAMARGVPVACSDRSSLPEVAGDAALLFDPADTAGIARALRRLLGDPDLRTDLARRGAERARSFTWRRTAELTLASYRRAIEARARR
jgi:glycosyltransferase involved in cell wall biosynthesis